MSAQPLPPPKTALPVSIKTPAVSVRPLTTIDDSTPAVSSLRLSTRVSPPPRPTSSFGQALLDSSLGLQTSTRDLRARLLASAERPSQHDELPDPHFGRALLGGTLGAGLGTGLGLLLLHEASRIDSEDDWRDSRRESPEERVAGMAAMIGIASIVAGGPIGAVEGGRIERRKNDAYVGAAVGEFVFGVLGYVVANRLDENTFSRLVGLGTGAALGSATGAILVASQQKNKRGLFQKNEGHWTMAPPMVRLHPNLSTRHPPSVRVTLMSLRW